MNNTQLLPTHSFTYDGVRINVYHADKGQGLPKHSHGFAHATMCNSGSCRITTESGFDQVITKNSQPLNLLQGNWHEIEALEDNTVFVNIFADGKY